MADEGTDPTPGEFVDKPTARRVDLQTKLANLKDSLEKKKEKFYALSEEIFDVNQDYLCKSDDLRKLRQKYRRNHDEYINSMTEMALAQAELRYRKEKLHGTSHMASDFTMASNTDAERYRSELKYALQKYQEARRTAKRLQNEFSKLSDGSRVQSLNFLAFCRYSQSTQLNEMNKLSLSEELPTKKEVSICKKEFEKCAKKSTRDLANFYKTKIHEFQREERSVMAKCITAMKINLARLNGADPQEAALLASSVDHHLQMNTFENRVAQKLVMEAQALLRADSDDREGSDEEWGAGRGRAVPSNKSGARAPFPHVLLDEGQGQGPGAPPAKIGSPGQPLSRGGKRSSGPVPVGAARQPHPPSTPLPSYAQPTRATTPAGTSSAEGRANKPRTAGSSSASKPVPAHFRAQLSDLYHSKKKAASALNELHAGRTRAVFDARQFRTAPGPESPLVHSCLLDSELTDSKTGANLVMSDATGGYVDQGQALGELMTQLCAAEGKFRQLNAIKEGLDLQLVKQAQFLALIARDLQADMGEFCWSLGSSLSWLFTV